MTAYSLLVEAALKATVVLAAAIAVIALLPRNASASLRHLVWGCSLVALLAVPALSFVLPKWNLGIFTPSSGHPPTSPALSAVTPIPLISPLSPSAGTPFDWTIALAFVWLGGVAACGVSVAGGLATLNRLARNTRELTDSEWIALAGELAARLRLSSPVRIVVSGDAAMPATWGLFRPTVLLSADAESWDPHLRRAVLLHELAHIRRRDCLMQLIAQLCCAIYWFHPAAWYAARRLRTERELACDEEVLELGVNACDYATHLLQMAARFHAPGQSVAALALARPSQLEGRLAAILSDQRNTRLKSTAATRAATLFAVVAFTLPVAAMRPWKAAVVAENAEIALAAASQSGSTSAADRAVPLASADSVRRSRRGHKSDRSLSHGQDPRTDSADAPNRGRAYDSNRDERYNPNPDPGYDPNPNPSYDPNPDPGYDPNPKPRHNPNPDPGYDPNPNPDRGSDHDRSRNPR